jgi:hypothetical protein
MLLVPMIVIYTVPLDCNVRMVSSMISFTTIQQVTENAMLNAFPSVTCTTVTNLIFVPLVLFFLALHIAQDVIVTLFFFEAMPTGKSALRKFSGRSDLVLLTLKLCLLLLGVFTRRFPPIHLPLAALVLIISLCVMLYLPRYFLLWINQFEAVVMGCAFVIVGSFVLFQHFLWNVVVADIVIILLCVMAAFLIAVAVWLRLMLPVHLARYFLKRERGAKKDQGKSFSSSSDMWYALGNFMVTLQHRLFPVFEVEIITRFSSEFNTVGEQDPFVVDFCKQILTKSLKLQKNSTFIKLVKARYDLYYDAGSPGSTEEAQAIVTATKGSAIDYQVIAFQFSTTLESLHSTSLEETSVIREKGIHKAMSSLLKLKKSRLRYWELVEDDIGSLGKMKSALKEIKDNTTASLGTFRSLILNSESADILGTDDKISHALDDLLQVCGMTSEEFGLPYIEESSSHALRKHAENTTGKSLSAIRAFQKQLLTEIRWKSLFSAGIMLCLIIAASALAFSVVLYQNDVLIPETVHMGDIRSEFQLLGCYAREFSLSADNYSRIHQSPVYWSASQAQNNISDSSLAIFEQTRQLLANSPDGTSVGTPISTYALTVLEVLSFEVDSSSSNATARRVELEEKLNPLMAIAARSAREGAALGGSNGDCQRNGSIIFSNLEFSPEFRYLLDNLIYSVGSDSYPRLLTGLTTALQLILQENLVLVLLSHGLLLALALSLVGIALALLLLSSQQVLPAAYFRRDALEFMATIPRSEYDSEIRAEEQSITKLEKSLHQLKASLKIVPIQVESDDKSSIGLVEMQNAQFSESDSDVSAGMEDDIQVEEKASGRKPMSERLVPTQNRLRLPSFFQSGLVTIAVQWMVAIVILVMVSLAVMVIANAVIMSVSFRAQEMQYASLRRALVYSVHAAGQELVYADFGTIPTVVIPSGETVNRGDYLLFLAKAALQTHRDLSSGSIALGLVGTDWILVRSPAISKLQYGNGVCLRLDENICASQDANERERRHVDRGLDALINFYLREMSALATVAKPLPSSDEYQYSLDVIFTDLGEGLIKSESILLSEARTVASAGMLLVFLACVAGIGLLLTISGFVILPTFGKIQSANLDTGMLLFYLPDPVLQRLAQSKLSLRPHIIPEVKTYHKDHQPSANKSFKLPSK